MAYRERDVLELYTSSLSGGLGRPELVDVETVCSPTRDEVLELDVPDVARALVALDHERLVPAIGIDVPVNDVLDSSAVRQTADGAASGLVAPDCGSDEKQLSSVSSETTYCAPPGCL